MTQPNRNESMVTPEEPILLDGRLLIALLIPAIVLVPTTAYAHSMEGLIVLVAAPLVTLTANFIKFCYLIIRNPATFSLFGNFLFVTFWETILLIGMVWVISPDYRFPDADLRLLVKIILWIIFFIVCSFFPNWLLIRQKYEPFTLSSRKNIKVLLLCLLTPAIILAIYLYLIAGVDLMKPLRKT